MSIVLLKKELDSIMPNGAASGKTDLFIGPLNKTLERFDVKTYARANCFLAHIAVESGELRYVEEDLYYLSGAYIRSVWPSLFRTDADAEPYAKNSAKLANFVYANRMGNGPVESGEGNLYRGHGLIQVTGKNNHFACADYFKIEREKIVEWLKSPEGATLSAGWYFERNQIWSLADSDTDDDFQRQTVAINGALGGYDLRKAYRDTGRKVFEAS